MFSLIITLVSIALVAALAIATLYFGGDAMNKGDASARAAQVVVQGQQVLSAADLFFADKGRWPNSVDEMVAEKYLQQVPAFSTRIAAADPALMTSAHAQAVAPTQALWTMPTPGKPTFTLENAVTPDVCGQVNYKVRGDNGILKKASKTLASQCFGEATSALVVVVTREPQELEASIEPGKVSADGVPTQNGALDTDSDAWLTAPGALPGVSGSGSNPPAVANNVFQLGTVPDPVGDGAELSVSQQGNSVTVQSTTSANTYGYVLVTNISAESAVFPFAETDNFYGFDGMSYIDWGPEDKALQIADLGYQFCETGGTLPAGGGCLISINVPDRCSTQYVEQQGPLSFVVKGPTSCPAGPAGILSFGEPPKLSPYINQFQENSLTPDSDYVQILDGNGGNLFAPRLDLPMEGELSMTLPSSPDATDNSISFTSATATVSGAGLADVTYPITITTSKGVAGDKRDGIFYLNIPVPGSAESGTSFSPHWQFVEINITYQYYDLDEGTTAPQTVTVKLPIVMANYTW